MRIEDSADFAGVPDAFQRLWTPHRMVYIDGQDKPVDASSGGAPSAARRDAATRTASSSTAANWPTWC